MAKQKDLAAVKRTFANVWLVLSVASVALAVSLTASLYSGKWHWFARSGALLTMAGVVLSVRPLIRMGLQEWLRYQSTIDGGGVAATLEELEAQNQAEFDARASQIGVCLAVVGTLVWACGDLLGGLP